MAEQVGKFLTELPELETPTDGDLMYIVDDETTSKKVTMANLKRVLGGNVTGTVEGASVSFSDGSDGIPMKECEVTIVPTQDLHGYSKPWVGGAGKNKIENTATSTTVNGVIFTVNSDGTVIADGQATGGNATIVICSNPNLEKGTSYILNGCPTGGGGNTYRLSYSNNVDSSYADNGNGVTFTEWTGTYNDRKLYLTIMNGCEVDNLEFKPMIRLATVQDESYEPYSNICPISGHSSVTVTVANTSGGSGEDYTVSLGSTYYGGTLDVTTGELTIDKAYFNLSNSGVSYYKSSQTNCDRFYTKISDIATGMDISGFNNAICDYFDIRTYQSEAVGTFYIQTGWINIQMPKDIFATGAAFKTWIESESVHLVYELSTPQTFTLAKEQIQTILGQNYVSHDGGGNIKVVYIRDLDIVINDLIDRVTALENE